MPLFEYRCECGKTKEVLCSFDQSKRMHVTCECGGPMSKIMSRAQFKVWHYGVEDMWGPSGAEANMKKCGVPL